MTTKIFEKVYDVRRTASDGKSSRGLWPGELKTKDRETRIPLKTGLNSCALDGYVVSVLILWRHKEATESRDYIG
jgi:hypothetical protein